jgi:hypothetical protein
MSDVICNRPSTAEFCIINNTERTLFHGSFRVGKIGKYFVVYSNLK